MTIDRCKTITFIFKICELNVIIENNIDREFWTPMYKIIHIKVQVPQIVVKKFTPLGEKEPFYSHKYENKYIFLEKSHW